MKKPPPSAKPLSPALSCALIPALSPPVSAGSSASPTGHTPEPAAKPQPARLLPAPAKGRNKPGREEVRHEAHRTEVPRQSERPHERGGQRRSRKP
jgi:hypothetical protein